MRRVVHFMGMNSTKFGGLERFMIELIKANPDIPFVLVYESYPISLEYRDLLRNNKVEIEVISFNTSGIISQFRNYCRIIKKYSPEIVHFHFTLNELGALAARFCGVKRVYKTVHSCLTNNNSPIENSSQLSIGQHIRFLGGLFVRLYTRIIFVSQYTKNQYERLFGALPSYAVVYLGTRRCDSIGKTIDNASLNIPLKSKVITSVLFSHPMKGADVLIKALPDLAECCTLVLIGLDDSPYTNELHALAEELGVSGRIRWVGITDNVSQYLSLTDVYVQPSRTEALSLASCEALSYGIPVVASDVGGLPEVASFVFETENSSKLAEEINLLLSDEILYERVSLEAVERYNKLFRLENSIYNYSLLYIMQSYDY